MGVDSWSSLLRGAPSLRSKGGGRIDRRIGPFHESSCDSILVTVLIVSMKLTRHPLSQSDFVSVPHPSPLVKDGAPSSFTFKIAEGVLADYSVPRIPDEPSAVYRAFRARAS